MVMDVINDVIDFFTSFFINFNACRLMMSNQERVIWLRLIEFPLHVWCDNFFKLVISFRG